MDSGTMIVVVASIFAIIAVAGFFYYRQSGATEIKLPFAMSIKVSGSNAKSQSKSGISAKEINSREGGFLAEESTGQGIEIEKVDVKDDVLLSSSQSHMNDSPQSGNLPFPNSLTAQALSAGGNITIQQFVGGQLPLAEQLEFFFRHIGLDVVQANRFKNAQFEAYANVWKSLQALRLAGDDLWEKADIKNLSRFADKLRKTITVVREGDLFFEEDDRKNLLESLNEFGRFRLGKRRLIEIRSIPEFEEDVRRGYLPLAQVTEQIEENYRYKVKYEKLLEKIRVSFKERLSN